MIVHRPQILVGFILLCFLMPLTIHIGAYPGFWECFHQGEIVLYALYNPSWFSLSGHAEKGYLPFQGWISIFDAPPLSTRSPYLFGLQYSD